MNAPRQFDDVPHRRFSPLSGRWVLVSPHRAMRPWVGVIEAPEIETRPRYDAACRLCPGNERTSGQRNPDYRGTFVFENDFPALMPGEHGQHDGPRQHDALFRAEPELGRCRVFCLSPRHDLSMALMTPADVLSVVDMWVDEYLALGAYDGINHVQIFENRGAMMGCSNPHPHGQIWANATVPDLVQAEAACQASYFATHGRTLLQDYLARELEYTERVVFANDSFVAVVPYWAEWPFETLIAPRVPLASLVDLSARQRSDFAAALREMNIRFDNVFSAPFPYTMGIHQSPTDGRRHPHWHFHVHYYPPLLRSAQVRKFMAGYEMLAMTQRDITPEQAASRLRAAPGHPVTAESR
jgi:UDPglucose--hexose-1-phosphate uridylyltransferase